MTAIKICISSSKLFFKNLFAYAILKFFKERLLY